MSRQPSKKPGLAAAAEALIEAASQEADAMTQTKLALALDSLKISFESNQNAVVQAVRSSNEKFDNFDAKINTLNQHVASVKSEIGALKTLLEDEKKQKTLERGLGLTHLYSFDYYEDGRTKDSSEFAKNALECFLLEQGLNLPRASLTDNWFSPLSEKVAAYKSKF